MGKPSLEVSLAMHMMNPEYGCVLSTGEPVGKSADEPYVEKFFRLHFNVYNTVETITCLSYKVLIQVHVSEVNDLLKSQYPTFMRSDFVSQLNILHFFRFMIPIF